MPRNTRDWAQRKLQEADGNIEWAVSHMAEVGQRYEEQHPEISDPLVQIIEVLKAGKKALLELRKSF